MLKLGFFLVAISFGWYMVEEVYGTQQIPELTKERSELLRQVATGQRLSSEKQAGFNEDKAELVSNPELTRERIELLQRIGGISKVDEVSSVNTSASVTDDLIALPSGVTTEPTELVKNISSTNSEWASFQRIDQHSRAMEGFAFSGWTTLSPSNNWSDEKIQAALVAGCNDDGARSLYVKLLSAYPGAETTQRPDVVKGQVGWDSSAAYSAPFTYDVGLNALRLLSGLDDSLSQIKAGNKVTIQIPWHNDQQATFEFPLKGSSKALIAAFDYCLSQTS